MFRYKRLKFKSISSLFILTVSLGLLSTPVAAMVELRVHQDSGTLMGAYNVNVGGKLFDVSFNPAKLTYTYPENKYTFSTKSDADLASQALLDQVFINGFLGNFDTKPSLTNGCSYFPACRVMTPYETRLENIGGPSHRYRTYVYSSYALNNNYIPTTPFVSPLALDRVYSDKDDISRDFYSRGRTVAIWKASTVSVVPEPSTYALMGLGMLCVMWASRRRQSLV